MAEKKVLLLIINTILNPISIQYLDCNTIKKATSCCQNNFH
ncbi:hypothetical protein SAMN05421786_10582 [Chryseobacterium ureilyticum]|uniref:Uncharacterized protein n=1 Tax=Chryseobacterium ureilyticum TaxID=373668 RepID=A0A1N7PDP0_9FLAO|nr:hypothetical protein SAMN05421786_10582 [Chryseobacterium ureilyticum]